MRRSASAPEEPSPIGILENNQVRVVVEHIPDNDGAALEGPITIEDSVVTLSGNATTVNLPHTVINDAYTITLLPPSATQ